MRLPRPLLTPLSASPGRCQRLAPTWEAVTEEIHNKYPEADGRIRLAKVRGERVELGCWCWPARQGWRHRAAQRWLLQLAGGACLA